jgi:hypothetical protein
MEYNEKSHISIDSVHFLKRNFVEHLTAKIQRTKTKKTGENQNTPQTKGNGKHKKAGAPLKGISLLEEYQNIVKPGVNKYGTYIQK